MYLYGLILQSGEFLSNRQKGEEQEHLLQAGWWNIRSANQAQKECRRGQVEHWAPWMTTSGQQSCLIWSRSLFCDAQGTPLTHWHYRKLSPVFPSNPPSASPLRSSEALADPGFAPFVLFGLLGGFIIITKLTILQNFLKFPASFLLLAHHLCASVSVSVTPHIHSTSAPNLFNELWGITWKKTAFKPYVSDLLNMVSLQTFASKSSNTGRS